jgi:hypothetical protein
MKEDEQRLNIRNAITEHIFLTHRFPSIAEISEITKLNRARCAEVCTELVKDNQLHIVFEGKGLPTVYVPYDMMQGLLMTQKKPDWTSKYSWKERRDIVHRTNDLNKQLLALEMFDRLLYATDVPLEEAVAFSLDWLEFKNVIHHKENPDNPDVTFEHAGKKVLVEVEGTTNAGGKAKVLQLDGWIRREIDKGIKAEELQGILVVNHFRTIEPRLRKDPLGSHAKEYLKRYDSRFLTTPFLFETLRRAKEEGLKKEEAREIIWQGEKIG